MRVDDSTDRWLERELTPWERQRRRYQLAEWRSQRSLKLVNSAMSCMRPLGSHVTVHVGSKATTHTSGIARCGSIWSCPVCAPQVRADRAADIEAAVEAWEAVGGEVYLVTATLPHSRIDLLDDTLGRLQKWWTDAWTSGGGRKIREASGVVGTVRVLEVTYGRNGWHPHIHSLFFCRPGEIDVPRIARQWRSRFEHAGIGDQYVPRVSIDVRPAHSLIGDYLGKVRQEWGVGLELARADLKSRGGITTAEILELAACGEARWVYRWQEWELATKGRRCIVWSRGLRNLAISWQLDARAEGVTLRCRALDLEERSEVEAAAGTDADQVVASISVPQRVWNQWKRSGRLGEFLQLLVQGKADTLGCWTIRPWRDPAWTPAIARSTTPRPPDVPAPPASVLALSV